MDNILEFSQCLTSTLNVDPNVRIAAELRLNELLRQPDAGLALSRIVQAQEADIHLRQISVILRKYITERWSPYFASFKGSAPPVEVKSQIRQAIFLGLSDPNRKIRSLCAHALSSIASCDWPDEYPDLLSSLISILATDSPDSVHGAMQVFTEFIKSDLTEDQILPVLRELLPVLLSILGAPEVHSAFTRARTVSVFRQCVSALYMVKEQYPQAVKEATASVLPVWLDALKTLLSIDPQQDVSDSPTWDGLSVRIEIFKTLDSIHTAFPRAISPYLGDLLFSSLHHLQVLYPVFFHYYISCSDSVPSSSEDDTIELPHLLCPAIDFIASIIRGGKAREWFDDSNVNTLTTAVFRITQMTAEDEDIWGRNANAFIAQEDDETQQYSVRVAGFDLLSCLVDRSPAQVSIIFQNIVQEFVVYSQQMKKAGDDNWWRVLEATLAAIGSQAETLLEFIDDEQDAGRGSPLNIEYLLADVVPSVLNLTDLPFLQGRAFVFASQFARLLPANLAGDYLEAAIQVIENDSAGVPVKVSAIKAVHNFCENSKDQAVTPFVARVAKDLGPFLLNTSEDTLGLVLDTLSTVLAVDNATWLTSDLADSVVLAVLEVWARNNKDPIFLSVLSDILTTMTSSSTPGIYQSVVKQALPKLCSTMASAKPDEAWIVGSAIELVTGLIRGAPENSLGDGFFALLAPNLFSCLAVAEDRDVIQNGIECLTMIIRKDCAQLLAWSDLNGQSGIHHVLSVIASVLRSVEESGGLAVGDLIIHLLRRAGEVVLPVLSDLLRAMIERMTTAKTASFLQSLIIPFAFLIHSQLDTVVSLLEQLGVQDRSGLEILIQTWCDNAETFQGFWPTRISDLALCQLYASERQSLQNLMVKGDLIVRQETKNVIMTRSRTKTIPIEFTSIPFPVKAVKILLHDVQSDGDAATLNVRSKDFDVDSDDEDEQWTEEEKQNQGFKEEEFAFLSDMLGPKGLAFDNDDILDDNDDEDLKNDPVSQMDMQGHLATFFRECTARNTGNFSVIVDQLSAQETLVIHKLLNR